MELLLIFLAIVIVSALWRFFVDNWKTLLVLAVVGSAIWACVVYAPTVWRSYTMHRARIAALKEEAAKQAEAEAAFRKEEEKARLREVETKRQEERLRLDEERKCREARLAHERSEKERIAKLHAFAMNEAPELWKTCQEVVAEIEIQSDRIKRLEAELSEFGYNPENDDDLNKIKSMRNDMIELRNTMWSRLQEAYIQSRKFAAMPDSKTRELSERARREGIKEAEEAARKFADMMNKK